MALATTSKHGTAVAQTREERDEFLSTLPTLDVNELSPGDQCPICLNSFAAILKDGPLSPDARPGVTKLQCGHIFCMADISEWIHTPRGSCPTCRDLFLAIPEPSDDESSDGGEYIPGSDSVVDDMMDGELWTDEDGDMWTDGEDMSLDEGFTEGETDWERSSEGVGADIDGDDLPAGGQLAQPSVDTAVINEAGEGLSVGGHYDDPGCEQIEAELAQWRTRIDHIQLRDWISNKDETRSHLYQGLCALRNLKPRIDAIERDTSAKLSFVQYALGTIQELQKEVESKFEVLHRVDSEH